MESENLISVMQTWIKENGSEPTVAVVIKELKQLVGKYKSRSKDTQRWSLERIRDLFGGMDPPGVNPKLYKVTPYGATLYSPQCGPVVIGHGRQCAKAFIQQSNVDGYKPQLFTTGAQ